MSFSSVTSTQSTLRARAQEIELEKLAAEYGMDKEALLGLVTKGVPLIARMGAGLIKGTAKAAIKAPGAVAKTPGVLRHPLRSLGQWAVKSPVGAAMGGLTAYEGGRAGLSSYRAHSAAMQGIRRGTAYRRAMQRARRINPSHQVAQGSWF